MHEGSFPKSGLDFGRAGICFGTFVEHVPDLSLRHLDDRMASIREIATHADVSIGTVSRVLNSHPNVSPEAREKVLQAVNDLRDSGSSGLRRGTSSIAFVYRGQSSINTRFDSSLLYGIAEELNQTDHDLMIVNAMRLRHQGESVGQMLLRRGVAGALVRTTSLTNTMGDELGQEGFPTVLVADRTDNDRIGSVYYDTDQAVRRAMEHLTRLGHRRIAIALNTVDDFDHAQRLQSYLRFLEDEGLPRDDRWILRHVVWQGNSGAVLRQVLDLPDRPTAIFVTDPTIATGICAEAMRTGVRIPEDLSVVGFDDAQERYGTVPRLSSVCQSAEFLGRRSLQHLLDIIDRRVPPGPLRFEGWFEPLGSTCPPPSD
jgi:LacI family transcriptional regulator